MEIQESGEMYLETILILSEKNSRVRAIDIAEYMGFSKPSVSRAMNLLRNGGFITDENGSIVLTPLGLEIAQRIFERHKTLSEMFISLGVDPEIATLDACRVEHVISDETFEAIKNHKNSK